jgi:hypothetical protein
VVEPLARKWRPLPRIHLRCYKALTGDEPRNRLIVQDVLNAVGKGRSPLVLTERVNHLESLASKLEGSIKNLIVLRGGMGAKQLRAAMDRLARIPANEECVLLATGRYIGVRLSATAFHCQVNPCFVRALSEAGSYQAGHVTPLDRLALKR